MMRDAGLEPAEVVSLKPMPGEGDILTVKIWLGRDRRIQTDAPFLPSTAEVA